jgi:aminomuconate-semialdehyde/2-hydroxymuconate-6-semialdehyde dehydrogenase
MRSFELIMSSTVRVFQNFINGSFVGGGKMFNDVSPVDGTIIAQVAEADAAIVNMAVAAARRAAPAWAALSVQERAHYLRAIADRIDARFDEFVAAEVADTGKDIQQAQTIDIARAPANFRMFADLATGATGESFETSTPDGLGALSYTIRKPLGVVAVISPWNLPLLLLSWKVAPALACGNTVVAKPSEETPFTATLLAEVMAEVGLPPGVFNLVHGFGQGSTGEFMTRHADIDAVTFTGESSTGSAIMHAVADTVKPISFELGGKNAALVFADCDLEAAIAGVARSSFANAGQVCLCTERVYVERPIFDAFVKGLKAKADAIIVGRPLDADVAMGPLISRAHREKVLQYFRIAEADGAAVIAGGTIPEFGDERDQGAFVRPTIWTGLSETSRCVKEEVFGPVCHVAPFDSEAEAVSLANDTRYGLASSIWTQNLSRAHRVAGRIDAGIVWINSWFLRDLRTPFGGVKLSGIGREGGQHSLNFYSEPTTVCVKL